MSVPHTCTHRAKWCLHFRGLIDMNNLRRFLTFFYGNNIARTTQLQLMLNGVFSSSGSIVVDVGCGTGLVTARIGQKKQVIGVDIEDRRKDHSFEFVLASMDYLPFKENTIDCLVYSSVLQYSTKPTCTLKEAHRILRPEGQFIISIPSQTIHLFLRHSIYFNRL